MAFSSYYKTETDPTIYGIAEEGQRVAFQNPEQFYESGGSQDFSNVTTDAAFNPAGAINYTDYMAKSQPTATTAPTTQVASTTTTPTATPTTTQPTQTQDISQIIGTRPSTVDPSVTEYYNAQTNTGFANPQELSNFINQTLGSTATNPENVFNYLNSPTGQQSLIKAQASGPAPQDAGEARAAVSKFAPPATNTAGIEQQLAADPGYQNFLKLQQEYNDITTQSKSLVDTYKQLMQESGIQGINADLLNMKKVIEGTEDDIRKEVQATSGLATESQVMALAGARNKQLTKNYNNLLAQKEMAMQTVQTMIGLSVQDRQFALQNILQKFNIEGQIQSYRDKFINNAKEGYNRIIEAVGYQGLYNMLSQDPSAVALAEKTLGLGAGTLQNIAQQVLAQKEPNAIAKGYPFYKYPGSLQVFDSRTNKPLSFEQYKALGGIGQPGAAFGDVFEVGKQDIEQWSDSYNLGGVTVQKNLKTGEIRTVVGRAPQGPDALSALLKTLQIQDLMGGTAGQRTAAGYAQRIQQAIGAFNQIESQYTALGTTALKIQGALPNALKNPVVQQYEQAQRNFINAVLRRESGAAISPSEFDSASLQYFHQPGDSEDVLLQKQLNRNLTLDNIINEAGRAYQQTYIPGTIIEDGGIYYKVETDGITLTPQTAGPAF